MSLIFDAKTWLKNEALPAGEVYTDVAPGTARGSVVVDRQPFEGQIVEKLTLTFEDGKLTGMRAGMVTVGIGNNDWAGGENTAPYGMTTHLPGSTLTIDGKAVGRGPDSADDDDGKFHMLDEPDDSVSALVGSDTTIGEPSTAAVRSPVITTVAERMTISSERPGNALRYTESNARTAHDASLGKTVNWPLRNSATE